MQNSLSNSSNSPLWYIAAASSTGKSHLDSGLPNQDSFFYQQTPEFSVAVVCDGAGSASMSEQGASYFANAVGNFLVKTAKEIGERYQFDKQDWLSYAIINTDLGYIRDELAKQIPTEFSLKDYHSTVTAILTLPNLNQALLLQIGDSPLLISQFLQKNQPLDYFENLKVFGDDDKNEYVNETHFITQENWQDFLRIEWLDLQNVDCIALMTDGCADLVLAGGSSPRQVYRPFFANLLFNLLQTNDQANGNALLQTALDNPATYRLTGDDKTLVVLVKNPQSWANLEPLVELPTQNANGLSENEIRENTQTSQSVWATSSEITIENSLSNFNTQPMIATADNITSALASHVKTPQNTQPEITPDIKPNIKKVSEKLPEPVSLANHQQTKKLLLASGGMLLGVLALAGLNRDWLTERFSTHNTPPVTPSTTNTAISEPGNTTLPTPPVTHDIDTPLLVHSLYEQSLLQVVIGYPDGKVINPASTPSKVWENAEQSRAIFAKANCEPLLATPLANQSATQLADFAKFNVTADPTWQYAKCQVTLQSMSQNSRKQWQASALPTGINEVVLPQGLSAVFSVRKPTVPASATGAISKPLQIYFLPHR